MELNEIFLQRMKSILGSNFDDYLQSLNMSPVRACRINTTKMTTERFLQIQNSIKGPVSFVQDAFFVPKIKLGAEALHHAGVIYSQEPSAMAPIEALDFEKSWNVLDLCAAPGGKSSQAKAKIPNGTLVCNEINFSRCKVLLSNVERLGLKNTAVICQKTKDIKKAFPSVFDVCIVDAPCSGEGMFRKDETAVLQWSQELVELCAQKQKEILNDAAECVKSGGYIIYSTCTFSLEENEMVIDDFLQTHPQFCLVPVSSRVQNVTVPGIKFASCKANVELARRFYPHMAKGEGQFMALLQNTAAGTGCKIKNNLKIEKSKLICEFLKSSLNDYDESSVVNLNGKVFMFNNSFAFPFASALCCGVCIGEERKNYVLPHHQLFSAFGGEFKNTLDLKIDDERVKRYLKGEEIEASGQNGFAAVLVENAPLGGGKIVGGKLKNHYPKGLRLIN